MNLAPARHRTSGGSPSRNRRAPGALLAFAVAAWVLPLPAGQLPGDTVARVDVRRTLDSLVSNEDTDGDKKITIDDPHIPGTDRGDKNFWLTGADNRRREVTGTYYLSNLLQELKLAEEEGVDSTSLSASRIFEPPVHRISRSIRELYRKGLTREIDERGLLRIIADEKNPSVDGFRYLYVPGDDSTAVAYYSRIAVTHPEWKIKVARLPRTITPAYVRSLQGRHGLLTLALRRTTQGTLEGIPFVVPGGRFNEMYGWDSYFIALGLLQDGRVELAKGMVENLEYEIDHYGAILNANRTYYLTRSQPPFFTSMALAVFHRMPRDSSSLAWLARALEAAIREYRGVWVNADRLTWTGLSRYYDAGTGPPPEVEPGAFDSVYAPYARRFGLPLPDFERKYREGSIAVPELDAYFRNDRSMRESGHDTSYRLLGRSADLVTVDLNSLLYKFERDIGSTIGSVFGGRLAMSQGSVERAAAWYRRAGHRRDAINRYLWNRRRGMFFEN